MLGDDFQLPLDAAGFSTRECALCQAEFKIRWSPRDAQALAAALAARLGHLNGGEAAAEGLVRHCPYCAAAAPPDAWWTKDQRRWFDEQARQLDDELRWRRLRLPLDTLAENPNPTYVTVAPRRAPPPELFADEDELITVPLPCCGEEIKVREGWIGPVRCHFCGFAHARHLSRDIGLELAQLRSWTALP